MRVQAFYSNKGLDELLMNSFIAGAKSAGEDAEAIASVDEDREAEALDGLAAARVEARTSPGGDLPDAVVLFGVKSRARFHAFRAAGVNTIILDKGYVRHSAPGGPKHCEYWRVAVNAHHPTRYLETMASPPDRFEKLGLIMAPWRKSGETVILAGSSEKYHRFNSLKHPTLYAARVVAELQTLTDRKIIYRPKPSWRDATPVLGAAFSRFPQRLGDLLPRAHALVTDGSNASFEAILAGVPTIVLGEAVSAPLSSTALSDIEAPRLAKMSQRLQWAADLAYCQWTMDEFRSGEAWPHIRKLLNAC